MMRVPWSLSWLVLCIAAATSAAVLGERATTTTTSAAEVVGGVSWDPVIQWGARCAAFRPINQSAAGADACSSSFAVSIATSAGIRACMGYGRDVVFSAQTVWDCYGWRPAAAAQGCLTGMGETWMSALPQGGGTLFSESVVPHHGVVGPLNVSACPSGGSSSGRPHVPSSAADAIIITEKEEAVVGGVPFTATRHIVKGQMLWELIMQEVQDNGPVVGILELTAEELQSLTDKRHYYGEDGGGGMFLTATASLDSPNRILEHAVVVYGWGSTAADGDFWRVQSSLGGRVKAARDLLSARGWYSFTTADPCLVFINSQHGCSGGKEAQDDDDGSMIVIAAQQQRTVDILIFSLSGVALTVLCCYALLIPCCVYLWWRCHTNPDGLMSDDDDEDEERAGSRNPAAAAAGHILC